MITLDIRARNRRGNVRFAAALLLGSAIGAIAAVPAHAQVNDASLRGRITAPAGGMPTEVVAIDVNTGVRRTSTVSADGSYNFPSLRAGTYRLDVVTPTGTRATDQFTLTVGQASVFDFTLDAPVANTTTADSDAARTTESNGDIIVTGNRLRQVDGGTIGATISQRLIDQLPQNNRNFLAFADLAPGVLFVESGTSGQARLQGGAQDSRTVNVFIDGVSQKDFVLQNGITGQDSSPGNPFPQLAIGEYQVLSSNYKAEFDQVSSVAITAGTRSGTNEFHGEAFVDYTDQNLRDARPTELAAGKIRSRDLQFGAALGGPIVRDVIHFFATYEGKRREIPVDIAAGNGRIDLVPQQFQGGFGAASSTFDEDLVFAKVNIAPTAKDLFEFSVKWRAETGIGLSSGINLAETATNTEVDEIRGLARWQHTEDNWVNDFRVSYVDASWSPSPAAFSNGQLFNATLRTGTTVSRFGVVRAGGGANFQDKGQKGWTVQDDFTYTGLQGHTIKVGVKASWVTLNSLQQNLFNPLYTYDLNAFSQTTLNTTIPYQLQFGAPSGPGNSVVTSDNFQFGLYAQDDWDVSDRLTLNLGLRWDYERTPSYLDFVTPQVNINAVTGPGYTNLRNADYNINDFISNGDNRQAFKGAFQPRLGFTYRLDGAGRFTMFGGYGRSYDRNQFDFLQQEISVGAYQTRTFLFQGADSQNPCTPSLTCIPWDPIYLTEAGRATLGASSPGGGRETRFISNDLKVPYSDQFSLGLRTRFNVVRLEVGYSHVESKDGFAFLLGNRRPDGSFFFDNPAITTDVPATPFTFTPPGFGSILIGTNGLRTSSDAAYIKLTKPYTVASGWNIDATYTYSEAEENRTFGQTFSLDFPSIDDYPTLRSSGVPRHRFVAAAAVDTPLGLTLSGKFQIQSPAFQKAIVNTSVPFERTIVGSFTEGNGDRWGRRQMDIAITKYVPIRFVNEQARIRFRVDIINAFNDRNYVDFNNSPNDFTRTSPTDTIYRERVGLSVGGNPPRTVKLSTGFSF